MKKFSEERDGRFRVSEMDRNMAETIVVGRISQKRGLNILKTTVRQNPSEQERFTKCGFFHSEANI